jgi:serine/threonine protein kinase
MIILYMNDSVFQECIKQSLIESINELCVFYPQEITFQGSLYVYQKEKGRLAQKRHVILTDKGLYIINRKKNEIDTDRQFVTVRVNILWSKVYFVDSSINTEEESPLPYRICFIFSETIANFYLIDKERFLKWRRVLEKVGIQTNFEYKYTINKKIGKGASASVFRITNKETKVSYACKVFKKKKLFDNLLSLKGLINEILVLKHIKGHPNVVSFEELHETDRNVLLVMELIEGDKIFGSHANYESHEVCNIIESLLSTLVYLKVKGIVHRDIKPDNLLLKYRDRPLPLNEIKIIDFGLSACLNSEDIIYQRCGTVGYLAPEILNPREDILPTFAVDIFALGIVLYNFITKTKAFRNNSSKNILQNNQSGVVDLFHPRFEKASPYRNINSQGFDQTNDNG